MPRAGYGFVLVLSVCAIAAASAATPREELDAALPARFVIGPPRAAAALAGVNRARDHFSEQALPQAAQVLWTKNIAGGIACEMLSDDAGRLFIAGLGRLTQLSADGSVEFAQSHPFSRPLAAVLLNDGTRVVLTEDLQLIGLSPAGGPRFAVRLSSVNASAPSLLPLWDGGLLVAVGAWLLNYDARGELRASAELGERVRVTLSSGRDNLIVGARGAVYRWDGYSGVTRVGAFGRAVLDAALNRGDSIVARLAEDELAELSLATGAVTPLSDAVTSPRSGLKRTRDRDTWAAAASSGALMLLRFAAGEPRERWPELSSPSLSWLGGSDRALATISANTPLTFHRPGALSAALPLRCSEPASLIPAGSGRVALGCRSGPLWLLGEAAAPSPADPESPRTEH
jgi:hypothetical protein